MMMMMMSLTRSVERLYLTSAVGSALSWLCNVVLLPAHLSLPQLCFNCPLSLVTRLITSLDANTQQIIMKM